MLLFDRQAQRLAFADKVLLSNELIEIFWSDPACERFHSRYISISQAYVCEFRDAFVTQMTELGDKEAQNTGNS